MRIVIESRLSREIIRTLLINFGLDIHDKQYIGFIKQGGNDKMRVVSKSVSKTSQINLINILK